MEDNASQLIPIRVGKFLVCALKSANGVELRTIHVALRVEREFFPGLAGRFRTGAKTRAEPPLDLFEQKLPERAAGQQLTQASFSGFSVAVAVFDRGAAVALEAATFGKVQKRAAEVVGMHRLLRGVGAVLIGVAGGEFSRRLDIIREQTETTKRGEKRAATTKGAITPGA